MPGIDFGKPRSTKGLGNDRTRIVTLGLFLRWVRERDESLGWDPVGDGKDVIDWHMTRKMFDLDAREIAYDLGIDPIHFEHYTQIGSIRDYMPRPT